MPPCDDTVRMRHRLARARVAVGLREGRARDDLDADRVVALALVRLLEMIGEAARRVSNQTQAQHGDVPWGEIVGLRNRLIHGYDSVDMAIVWEILTGDLPPLVETLQAIPGVKEPS